MPSILVVEDEPAIAELIAMHLRHGGYEAKLAFDAHSALRAVQETLPDLVVLDWMLPGESGLQLAQRWRRATDTCHMPILMLTARSQERDIIEGLDAGADDYLTKPFSPSELLARIRSVLRSKASQCQMPPMQIGPLMLNPATMRVTVNDKPIKVGPTEFRLLRFLMSHSERVHSRALLLDQVWGDQVFIQERTVDVHVKRLRETLTAANCGAMLETVRGTGYRLTNPTLASV